MPIIQVRDNDQLRTVKNTLFDVFVDYPLFPFLFENSSLRRQGVEALTGRFLDKAFQDGTIAMTADGNGMICWLMPKSQSLSPVEELSIIIRLLALMPPMQWWRKVRYLLRLKKSRASQPHVYVFCSAVRPECAGSGYAKELVDFMKSALVDCELPLCAETAKELNLKIWGTMGFETYGVMEDSELPQYLLMCK